MDQVSEVKSKVDIVEVIRRYVELKKAGRNYKGLCPFHSEKTPSFMVSPELQIYKCFGCGESGDVISFLEKHEGMEFYEVLKMLAEQAGVKLKAFEGREKSEREKAIELNSVAARFYHYVLLKHKWGEEHLRYLKEEREIGEEAIGAFKLGAAPAEARVLGDYLTRKKGYKMEELERAGLVIRTERGVIDRFRGRVIFPIMNHRGQVVALAGRVLPARDSGRVGKYINSPETVAYHKSDSLYGLSVTKGEIRSAGEAIVVEGELDLISMWQAGLRNVVAIKGTALTEGQARILARFTSRIVLALDSDFAGDTAAVRGSASLQELGLEIRVARLGEYKDPDEAARKDAEGLKKKLAGAVGIWDFLIDYVFEKYGGEGGVGKARVSRELVPILSSIGDKIVQAHYVKLVAERLGVSEEAVGEQMKKVNVDQRAEKEDWTEGGKQEESLREGWERRLLAVMFQNEPGKLSEMKGRVVTSWAVRILEEFEKYSEAKEEPVVAEFAESLPAELRAGFDEVFLQEVEVRPERVGMEIDLILRRIERLEIGERMAELGREIAELEKRGAKKDLARAEKEFVELGKKRGELEQED